MTPREQRAALARKVARDAVRGFFRTVTDDAHAQPLAEAYPAELAGSNPKVGGGGDEHALP